MMAEKNADAKLVDEVSSTVAGVLAIAVAIGLIVGCAYLNVIMWGWFAVPMGIPAVGLAHMIGISCLIGTLKGPNSKEAAGVWEAIKREAMLFGIAALAHLFM